MDFMADYSDVFDRSGAIYPFVKAPLLGNLQILRYKFTHLSKLFYQVIDLQIGVEIEGQMMKMNMTFATMWLLIVMMDGIFYRLSMVMEVEKFQELPLEQLQKQRKP